MHSGAAAEVVLYRCHFLFIALAFFPKPEQAAYLALYFIIELVTVKGYLSIRLSRGREVWTYRIALLISILPLILSKLSGLWGGSLFAFLGISYLTFDALRSSLKHTTV